MATETKTPDTLLGTTSNLSGGLSAINVDDTTWLTADSNNTNSVVAVGFPTPTGSPNTGTDLQNFTLKYRVTANASTVTFNAYLYENGSVLNGGTAIDTWTSNSTTEVTRQIPWNASLLGTADGSLVELMVVATKTGGAPSNRTTGEYQFIDWDVDYATAPDALTADNISSSTTVSSPAIGQVHGISADNISSGTRVSSPAVAQEHALLADGISVSSTVSQPDASESNILLTDAIQSGSTVSSPAIGQEHALLSSGIASSSTVEAGVLAQVHTLSADGISSASTVSSPALAEGSDSLLADNISAQSQVSTPAIGQEHALTARSVESATILSIPTLAEISGDVLTADNIESGTTVSSPTMAQVHVLVPSGIACATTVSIESSQQAGGVRYSDDMLDIAIREDEEILAVIMAATVRDSFAA